jgi:3-deoxy-7-phosphoheptulonate synthase
MTNLKLAALNGDKKRHTVITVDNVKIGEDFVVIAGPCSVESEAQTIGTAREVKDAGANTHFLRRWGRLIRRCF